MKTIFHLAKQETEYVINGVKYIVSSSFQTAKIESNPTITDRFKRIVTGDEEIGQYSRMFTSR